MQPPSDAMRLMDGWEGGALYGLFERMYSILEGREATPDIRERRLLPLVSQAEACIFAAAPSTTTITLSTATVRIETGTNSDEAVLIITAPETSRAELHAACEESYPSERNGDELRVRLVSRRSLDITPEDHVLAAFSGAETRAH